MQDGETLLIAVTMSPRCRTKTPGGGAGPDPTPPPYPNLGDAVQHGTRNPLTCPHTLDVWSSFTKVGGADQVRLHPLNFWSYSEGYFCFAPILSS